MILAVLAWLAVQGDVSFEEKRLATIPDDGVVGWVAYKPCGGEVSYAYNTGGTQEKNYVKGGKWLLFKGSKQIGEYAFIQCLRYSPDGSTLTYVANTGGEPDPQMPWRVRGGKTFVYSGDRKFGPYERVENPQFGESGSACGFWAQEGEKVHVVWNGEKGKEFDAVGSFEVEPSGQRVAYVANEGGRRDSSGIVRGGRRIIVRGSSQKEVETRAGSLVWSSDGRVLAYIATTENEEQFVVVEDKAGPKLKALVERLTLSPDGSRWAYCSRSLLDIRKWRVYIDHKGDGREFAWVSKPAFSPDGKRISYVGFRGDMDSGQPIDAFLIEGDEERSLGELFDASEPEYSADGRSIAMIGGDCSAAGVRSSYVLIDGKKGGQFDRVSVLGWSDSSKKFWYLAKRDEKEFVVAGDTVSGGYDWITDGIFNPKPSFSSDGKKAAFGARIGRELWWKVVEIEK